MPDEESIDEHRSKLFYGHFSLLTMTEKDSTPPDRFDALTLKLTEYVDNLEGIRESFSSGTRNVLTEVVRDLRKIVDDA